MRNSRKWWNLTSRLIGFLVKPKLPVYMAYRVRVLPDINRVKVTGHRELAVRPFTCLSVCLRFLLTSRLSTSLVIDTLIHPAGLLTLSSESLEDECVTLRNLRIIGYFKQTRTLLWKWSKQIFVVVLVGDIAKSPFFCIVFKYNTYWTFYL